MTGIERRWCLLLPDRQQLTAFIEGGEIRHANRGTEAAALLLWSEDHCCFTTQPKAVMALCDARQFVAKQRRERISEFRFHNGDCKVATLPKFGPDDPYEYAIAFATYCEWLRSLGIRFTKRIGWSGLGRQIAKLYGIPKFEGPRTSRLAFYGGRKQAPYPATFKRTQHFDITAAYLHSLGAFPIPAELKACNRHEWSTSELDGICFADVVVPEEIGEWLPLPSRAEKRIVRHLRFDSGNLQGAWPFSELRMAAEYGCSVEPIKAFAGQRSSDYFGQWFKVMVDGRNLPNGANLFAKQHANLLWSSFATSPTGITYKIYRDEFARQPIILKRQEPGKDFSSRTAFVSAIVSARVRERIYTEVLCPDGNPNLTIVHCDTDGVISGSNSGLPSALRNLGIQPGLWRKTKEFPLVDIRSPNSYRYICNDCGFNHARWHYVCAGASSPELAKKLFKESAKTRHTLNLNDIEPDMLSDALADYKPKRRVRKYETISDGHRPASDDGGSSGANESSRSRGIIRTTVAIGARRRTHTL